ncbi:MAG: response regulator [Gemmatimonadetes bacterium]|jgi:DNA-binding response OmpR family regulator|nr:response regulator [Gemmatimonadota bacterium]MBP9200035.1 response regulator [Gemmatimonadales bacterium]MBK6779857.1 response regulator [Gemmatimonadota bacterium]MBK7717025.1 response regulator [Gemmatimonadota bacterium]MBK7922143.1 response regulator [Gemmatimonadota bacterium]
MRLLVIEDDSKVAGFLEQGFREEGFEVEVAREGLSGFTRGRDGAFDLILLDYMLPGQDGPAVVGALRREGVQTPVLMLTARDDPRDIRTAMDAGADGYITKPFRFDDLLDRIHALLTARRLFT